MPVDPAIVAQNDAERTRLRSLVARLSEQALSKAMPAGWTVAAVLAHVALWDARVIFFIDRWSAGATPSAADYEPEDVDWINDSAKPLCLALRPRDAAQLALRLAEEADAKVAALSDALLAKIQAADSPVNLVRATHRREHLDEIERALAEPGER
jgi:hypothetical protein